MHYVFLTQQYNVPRRNLFSLKKVTRFMQRFAFSSFHAINHNRVIFQLCECIPACRLETLLIPDHLQAGASTRNCAEMIMITGFHYITTSTKLILDIILS